MKLTVILIFILLSSSCSLMSTKHENDEISRKADSKDENLEGKNEKSQKELEDVVAEAQPLINNILSSMNEANYESYIKDFNPSMKSAYHDKKIFFKTCEERKSKYGDAGARPVYKIEKKKPFYNIYYLVKFSKIEKPVPVFLSVEKDKGALKVVFLQFRFSELKE